MKTSSSLAGRSRARGQNFWGWFTDLRETTEASGRTFGAYCWHKGAEQGRFRDLSAHDDSLTEQVDEFTDSESWVDLLDTWKHSYTTGTGNGLKVVADVAGFAWRVDTPSGELSMTYYNDQLLADDAARVDEARAWLLSYNEDDCLATHHIRNWLTGLVAASAAG